MAVFQRDLGVGLQPLFFASLLQCGGPKGGIATPLAAFVYLRAHPPRPDTWT